MSFNVANISFNIIHENKIISKICVVPRGVGKTVIGKAVVVPRRVGKASPHTWI